MTITSHLLPRISPQIDHKNTMVYHPDFSKTPCKNTTPEAPEKNRKLAEQS